MSYYLEFSIALLGVILIIGACALVALTIKEVLWYGLVLLEKTYCSFASEKSTYSSYDTNPKLYLGKLSVNIINKFNNIQYRLKNWVVRIRLKSSLIGCQAISNNIRQPQNKSSYTNNSESGTNLSMSSHADNVSQEKTDVNQKGT